MGKFNKTSIISLRTRLRKNCLSLIMGKENTENKEYINENQNDIVNDNNDNLDLEENNNQINQDDQSIESDQDEQIISKNKNPFLKTTEDEELNEIVNLENKIYEKATKNGKSEPLMTLINDTHFLSFQQNSDLFTLLYSSIIFKWIKSEKVSYFIIFIIIYNIIDYYHRR